jgi:hypothetical protein
MARALVTYQGFLRKLDPRFDDCPEPCARSEEDKDLPDLCHECEVRRQWNFFQEDFETQISLRFREEKTEWSFDSLFADVNRVRLIDAQVRGKGYPKNGDALLNRCLDILRSEEFRPRRIALWELDQKRPQTDG